ncbi:unnamed protein product [Brassica rapa subsp. trilocularis]
MMFLLLPISFVYSQLLLLSFILVATTRRCCNILLSRCCNLFLVLELATSRNCCFTY